jgi:release factor glutamine methyltransferase
LNAAALTALLAREGFVAADEEADELLACAGGDEARLAALVERRLTGEPLAWITGSVQFCGLPMTVHPGVYVPRWQSELLTERALERLPAGGGRAIDLCTGCGAIARVLAVRAGAAVAAGDVDPRAVACARANGVEAHAGDLFDPLPPALAGTTDVVTGVLPYVPTADLPLLQRDTFTFETPLAYDGGTDGLEIVRRVIAEAPMRLRGSLLLELGGDQAAAFDGEVILDEEGDVRGIELRP